MADWQLLWHIHNFKSTSPGPPLPRSIVLCSISVRLKFWCELQLISFEECQTPLGQSMRRARNHWCNASLLWKGNFSVLTPFSPSIEAHDNSLSPPPAHSRHLKKLGSPMLETIFQREHLPAHRCCLRLWSPSHAEMNCVKVFLGSRKHSINVRPYYFLLFLLLHNGLHLVYHSVFTAQSRVFWPSHWNVSLGSCPLAPSRPSVYIVKSGFTWTELTKLYLKRKICSSVGIDSVVIVYVCIPWPGNTLFSWWKVLFPSLCTRSDI